MDPSQKPSALHNLLKMFGLSNLPTSPTADDELAGEVDEPPDHVPELKTTHRDPVYTKSTTKSPCCRRESLLTRAIMNHDNPPELTLATSHQPMSRALSTASSQSFPSTAELTSDGDLTSPTRSASPSPPMMTMRLPRISVSKPPTQSAHVVIAPVTKDDKPVVAEVGEAAVEKSLGRKRCIMFACSNNSTPASKEVSPAPQAKEEPKIEPKADPAPRKCRLTFICPPRQDSNQSVAAAAKPAVNRTSSASSAIVPEASLAIATEKAEASAQPQENPQVKRNLSSQAFHEFGSSHDETDAWVDQPEPAGPKLTLDDCNRKENAIRQIAKEAEEEAEAEAEEQDDLDPDLDEEQDLDDDFAPSDEESDDGNESDDENGFADSDDESDDGSEYRFWAPATSTAATSADNLTHFSSRQRSRSSTLDSADSDNASPPPSRAARKIPKVNRLRPGTPELPDSTDFVCGTLDEDRPLEAAFIACREQKKRSKHIPIPQDIDPSFPTSDPENDDDDEDEPERLSSAAGEPHWLKDQFAGMDEESRGRRPSAFKVSPIHTPAVTRPVLAKTGGRRNTNRSPPPPKHRSPPPKKLFGRSPARFHSPPPLARYRSPRGSPTNLKIPLGITINRLAQRPGTTKTASLPQTPNPFFKNWRRGSPPVSCIPSGAVTPGGEAEEVRPDMHVRGPVDIVIGLEKKRQKRKEKFWRLHCRKAAKEQAERKPVPGRGVERMKELGLECAERTRGYGLGQQANLVLSL